jgi:hypothetical protein
MKVIILQITEGEYEDAWPYINLVFYVDDSVTPIDIENKQKEFYKNLNNNWPLHKNGRPKKYNEVGETIQKALLNYLKENFQTIPFETVTI